MSRRHAPYVNLVCDRIMEWYKICSLIFLPFKSGHEGRSCLEKDDCGRGYCVWNDQEQKGICRDNPRGCVGIINGKGKPEEAPVCFD